MCIAELSLLRPPSVSPSALNQDLDVLTMITSKWISQLAQAKPPLDWMTLLNAYMIGNLFLGWWLIAYLTCGTMRSNGPAHWLDYCYTHVMMCTWYYKSCCIEQNLKRNHQIYLKLAPSPVCSDVYSWLHSIVHSQPAWQMLAGYSQEHNEYTPTYSSMYVLKYTPGHALNDTPNCTQWHTSSLLDYMLPSKLAMHSQAYSQAHSRIHSQLHSKTDSQPAWYMLPWKIKSRSHVYSKYAPKYTKYILMYTPSHAVNDAPNCTQWHTPSHLDCMLPCKLTRRSQAHSEYAPRFAPGHALKAAPNCTQCTLPADLALHSHSHLTISFHVCFYMHHPGTCWVADARHQEAWSR